MLAFTIRLHFDNRVKAAGPSEGITSAHPQRTPPCPRPAVANRVVSWYDGTIRTLELASQTAVWYHHGKPPVPTRWVLIRDPQGELDTQALLCIDQTVAPTQILEWFVLR